MRKIYEMQCFIDKVMSLLNGKINTLLYCYDYHYSFIDSKVAAGEHNGSITFYMNTMYMDYSSNDYIDSRTRILMICAHELSHIDQCIDYEKYHTNEAYRIWIERNNDLHALKWLLDHTDYLVSNLGYLYIELIQTYYDNIKTYPYKYIKMTIPQMVCRITEDYLMDNLQYRFWEFSYILLVISNNGIENTAVYIKKDDYMINPNTLYPLLHKIRNYSKYRLNNRIPSGTNGCIITIDVQDKDKELVQLLNRLNPMVQIKMNTFN